jgi:hypothetical protein
LAAGAEDVVSSVLCDVGRWAGYDRGRFQEDELMGRNARTFVPVPRLPVSDCVSYG